MNHPVIIGVGQVTHHEKIKGDALSSLEMACQAITACVTDTGRDDLLKYVDSLSVVNISVESMTHPEESLCRMLGINPAMREQTAISGTSPQWLVSRAADKIAAGEIKMALLVGAEALYRDKLAQNSFDDENSQDEKLRYLQNEPTVVGDTRFGSTPYEDLYGAKFARHVYPLLENALRGHLRMGLDEYRRFLAGYYKSMAEIARHNPLAWFNQGKKAKENVTVATEKNPYFNFPYTKFMNPNPRVNQAAAVIITDTDTARKLSIPRDKWVFPHAGGDAADKWYISERVNYFSSPAIRMNVAESLKYAGLDLSDINFFDIYSCYPCAAMTSALAIGLDINQLPPLSITGGLSYFGGPGSNYVMHAIAHAVERLRKNPEQFGLITGVGWYLSKHSTGIYSGIEPKRPWDRTTMRAMQPELDAMPSPEFCKRPQGEVTIETYAVLHDFIKEGPVAVIIGRLDSGARCMALSGKDLDLALRMEQEDFLGRRVSILPTVSGPNIFQSKGRAFFVHEEETETKAGCQS